MTRTRIAVAGADIIGQVIRGEAEPVVSVRDGLLNLRVTEAIAHSARTGLVIELPTP